MVRFLNAFGAPHPLGRRTTSRRAVLFCITVCKSSFALRPHQWQCIVIIATPTRPPRRDRHGSWQPNGRCITCILGQVCAARISQTARPRRSSARATTAARRVHYVQFLRPSLAQYGSTASTLDARAGLRRADARCSCSPPVRDPQCCTRDPEYHAAVQQLRELDELKDDDWRPIAAVAAGFGMAPVHRLGAVAQSRAAFGEQQQSMNMTSMAALVNHGALRRPCRS